MTIEGRRRRKRARRLLGVAAALVGLLTLGVAALAGWLGYAQWRTAQTETRSRHEAAPPGGRWVHAFDTDIHVREWGAPTDKPLLLVHGTGAWAGTWVSNADALANAGFRVVAMDLPPFGFSEPPASRDYSRQAQARRIQAVMEQLGGTVTLLGHSFGGGPAAEAAMRDPARVEHLVLVDAAIGLQPDAAPPCEGGGVAGAVLGWRGLRTALVSAAATEPAFSGYWLGQFVARKEAVTPQRTAIYQQPFMARGFSQGLGDWAYQFATGCEQPASVRPENFRGLRIPVTLLWGAEDTITPLAQAQRLKSLLPRGQLKVLPGVGHIPQIEDVAQFNAAVVMAVMNPPP